MYKILQHIKKKNQDDVHDAMGKDLLDLCISNQIVQNVLLMESVFGMSWGNLRFKPTRSTVDYLLASENIIDQILFFNISIFIPILSDFHCKLS